MSTYIPQLTNEAANVKAVGKITKGGYRFTPAGERQAVANVNLAFRRSWGKRENGQPATDENGRQIFDSKTSYVKFALWGEQAERFNAMILKSGGTEQRDVRVEAVWSMADLDVKPWEVTKQDGSTETRYDVSFRAQSLTITGNYAFGNADNVPAVGSLPLPEDGEIQFDD